MKDIVLKDHERNMIDTHLLDLFIAHKECNGLHDMLRGQKQKRMVNHIQAGIERSIRRLAFLGVHSESRAEKQLLKNRVSN